jgi:hypothetical protein
MTAKKVNDPTLLGSYSLRIMVPFDFDSAYKTFRRI